MCSFDLFTSTLKIFSVTTKICVCSSRSSYFVLLGSVHIPAVLCYVLVSRCSSILYVYVASCFFIKFYIFICKYLYDPIKLNKDNFIIATIIISNMIFLFSFYKVVLFQGCPLDLHCILFLKIFLISCLNL